MNNRENSHVFLCVSPTMHLMKKAREHMGGQGRETREPHAGTRATVRKHTLVSAPVPGTELLKPLEFPK